MKSLISINEKFFKITPRNLVKLINKSKYCKGVEINFDHTKKDHLIYLDQLVFELKRNNLILQVHANNLNINDQIEYMHIIEKYSDILGYPIVVCIHSLYDEDENKSINKTIEYMQTLTNNIDNNKIILSLENLNDAPNLDRLNKEIITPIIANNEKLYMTYDIGHEIADHGYITDLNKYIIPLIRNVHIHTHNDTNINGYDHLPIYPKDSHWNEILKGILFLINNDYKGNIVFEYDLYRCMGSSTLYKIIDYLNSIDYVSEHFN